MSQHARSKWRSTTREATWSRAILDALVASGKDIERLTPRRSSLVDEFHTGGRQATVDLAEQVDFRPGMHITRHRLRDWRAVALYRGGARLTVTGIDLTEDYVRTAGSWRNGSALRGASPIDSPARWPFPSRASAFDGAYMMHVGMNMARKSDALRRSAPRPNVADTCLPIYDMMRTGGRRPALPVHWAATLETSFVASVDGISSSTRCRRIRGRPRTQPP